MSLKQKFVRFTAALAMLAGFMSVAAPASAQVLIIDTQRVQTEAAAYKDFRLQTAEFTQQMNVFNSAIQPGGALEQEAVALNDKKATIGTPKFNEEMTKLRQLRAVYEQNFDVMNVYYQRMLGELATQVQRAQGPIVKKLLQDRKAQIIVPKSMLIDYGPGLDITTEVIEALDLALPTVKVTIPQFTNDGNAQEGDAAPTGESTIDELPEG